MNKTEKIICMVLGAVIAWYLFNMVTAKPQPRNAGTVPVAQAPAEGTVPKNAGTVPGAEETCPMNQGTVPSTAEGTSPKMTGTVPVNPAEPEETAVLENDDLRLGFTSWGGAVKKATLKRYGKFAGAIGEKNPAVEFDFAAAPLGAVSGVPGLAPNAAYKIEKLSETEIAFSNASVRRVYTLLPDYQLSLKETFASPSPAPATTTTPSCNFLSLGRIAMGASKSDLLSVDSWTMALGEKGRPLDKIVHHADSDSPLKPWLQGSAYSGGCSMFGCGSSGAPAAAMLKDSETVVYPGAQKWIALKNRFFVTALVSSDAANSGFTATVARNLAEAKRYRPESVSCSARFDSLPAERASVFYVGPKKQSILWDLGMKDVMEFGMWRVLCYPLVWVLNVFDAIIPNYGVAIILLTILVRLIFWPLQHKSTVSMKKMSEIQPLMKEIQAKYKDNPQRLQQETWALYREHKVNPLSSCLPMLIQIPVFIALFTVLRSAVELRYAPFLWISDLSEPEALGATSWFPFFGGLNILPLLMAGTTFLQSYLTPSTGDKQQQKMMMLMMPLMMLFFFYNFASALSLYWAVSNLIMIVQMWMIRRQTAPKTAKAEAVAPDAIIDPPVTRQMKRHS